VKRGDWHHDSHHRRGVNYKNKDVRTKYAKGPARDGDRKLDYRGRGGEQVLKPGDRPGGDCGRLDLGKGPGGDEGPGGKGPDLGEGKGGPGKQAALEGKPDLGKRPDQGQSKTKNAFDPSDGKKARDYSKRGQASLGNRGSRDFAKPKGPTCGPKAGKRSGGPKVGGGGGKARGGGGRKGGGGRGGGRRR
jgi:hypothetical protein